MVAMHAWRFPRDPSIYGTLDVDASRALAYLDGLREQTGRKVTLAHLVGKAIAMALAEQPDVNAVIRRGHRVYLRERVDIFFQISAEGGRNLSGATIWEADRQSQVDIADELRARAEQVRAHRDQQLQPMHERMRRVPSVLRGPLLRGLGYLTFDLNLDLSRLRLPYDAFGSAMVTNVGSFGLPRAWGALVPFSRVPIVMAVGAPEERPVAVDGAVTARPVLPLGATLDHRRVDGAQAGRLAARFRQILEDPAGRL